MTGLDTNILVRYIMQDDAKQSPKANHLIESLDADNLGFISIVSVIELFWVLTPVIDEFSFGLLMNRTLGGSDNRRPSDKSANELQVELVLGQAQNLRVQSQ